MSKINEERPKVGVGVIIVNDEGKVLIGKRTGSHAPYYSIPGGHLELGETFEQAAIKEVKEETNLSIENPKVICITNNLKTFALEGQHYISIILLAKEYSGKLTNLEPNKCEGYQWVKLTKLPQPHFDASEQGIKCYLDDKFYLN